MDQKRFEHPLLSDRPYRLQHDTEGVPEILDRMTADGFGGIVTNAAWHTAADDPGWYLGEEADFRRLDEVIEACSERGMGVWLYDEKGYPSASADGITMLGHPEYEARGFTEIRGGGEGTVWRKPDLFEKIIFACRDDGAPVPFDAAHAEGADRIYAVRPVFEGSHAQKCGWGPRRYPNLLDRKAVASFLRCTYDRYYEKTGRFDRFDAVFTDEPSLMSGYVNCGEPMPFVFLPWAEGLPETFRRMHGRELTEDLPVLFSREERFEEGKLRFWQTVAEMMNEAFFAQINDWCDAHGIAFSGHCLLEESLSMHVPLYGNLLKQLKTFRWPGVDMLTGNPEAYKNSPGDYAMACRYVGGAARMSGKTERVMVEICPLPQTNNMKEFTFAEERGTMDLIFRAGINHINSYLTPERLNGDYPQYAAIFGRSAYMLRGARWTGRIGLYVPVETAQGFYYPDYRGMNSGASVSLAILRIEETMRTLNQSVAAAGLDHTVIDGDWIAQADCENGVLTANGLEIGAVLLPAVRWMDPAVRAKLNRFAEKGGTVLWVNGAPEDDQTVLSPEEAVKLLSERIRYDLPLEPEHPEVLFVSPYEKEGKGMWYLVNSSPEENRITIGSDFPCEIWETFTGRVSRDRTVILPPYSSAFVTEG
jgi:hypothetical protein